MKRFVAWAFAVLAVTILFETIVHGDTPSLHPGKTWARLSLSGNLKLILWNVDGDPKYSIARKVPDEDWRTLIEPSLLGLLIDGAETRPKSPGLYGNDSSYPGEVRREWIPLFDKTSSIRDDYNAIDLEWAHVGPAFGRHVYIQAFFRVYDGGIALRYHIIEPRTDREQPVVKVLDDLTEFCFADDYETWSYNGELAPKGPLKLSQITVPLRMPVTLRASDDCYMALQQAALDDWDIVELKPIEGFPKGLTVALDPCEARLKKDGFSDPFCTPWHVIQVADSRGELLESNILVNLADKRGHSTFQRK